MKVNMDEVREQVSLITKRAREMDLFGKDPEEVMDKAIDCSIVFEQLKVNMPELDYGKLLNFDDFNFIHDVIGILVNINRNNFSLGNCFLPRCY